MGQTKYIQWFQLQTAFFKNKHNWEMLIEKIDFWWGKYCLPKEGCTWITQQAFTHFLWMKLFNWEQTFLFSYCVQGFQFGVISSQSSLHNHENIENSKCRNSSDPDITVFSYSLRLSSVFLVEYSSCFSWKMFGRIFNRRLWWPTLVGGMTTWLTSCFPGSQSARQIHSKLLGPTTQLRPI